SSTAGTSTSFKHSHRSTLTFAILKNPSAACCDSDVVICAMLLLRFVEYAHALHRRPCQPLLMSSYDHHHVQTASVHIFILNHSPAYLSDSETSSWSSIKSPR